AHAAVGTTVNVEIRGQGVSARVVPTPFYKRPKKAAKSESRQAST
ncbi:MAG: glycine cleavage T C-terminal barrel domain-containing protein, partial [Terriglobales bacterium]